MNLEKKLGVLQFSSGFLQFSSFLVLNLGSLGSLCCALCMWPKLTKKCGKKEKRSCEKKIRPHDFLMSVDKLFKCRLTNFYDDDNDDDDDDDG